VADRPAYSSPDDLFEFPSELESAPTAGNNGQPEESVPPAAPRIHAPVPPPTPSTVDALLEFAVDNGRPQSPASRQSLPPVHATLRIDEPSALRRWQPFVVRWVLPSAAAFVVGVMSVLVTLREPEPTSPRVERTPSSVARATREPAQSAPPARSEPALLFDLSIAPGAATGTLGQDELRELARVPQAPTVVAPRPVAAPQPVEPAPAPLATAAIPQTERSIASRSEAPATPPAQYAAGATPNRPLSSSSSIAPSRSDAPPAIDAPPIVPLATNARGADLPDAIVIDPPRSSRPVSEPPAPSSAHDENAVRLALISYENAYETLNVAAAAEVWPNVDKERLTRAFGTLKSQGLEFQSCSITVRGASAAVYCRGKLEYVRKVGNPTPLMVEQQWQFKLRRLGTGWKIDEVLASQAPVLAAQRTRGQG